MKGEYFEIKIRNLSKTDNVYYYRRKPLSANEVPIPAKGHYIDEIEAPFSELEFNLYRRDSNQDKRYVVFEDLKVRDTNQETDIDIKPEGNGTISKVNIKYYKEIKLKLTSSETPPNVEAGVKE